MNLKYRLPFLICVLIALVSFLSWPELRHLNSGESRSIGSVRHGSLENGWLMPFRGDNFFYFSPGSYFILDNAYVHNRLYRTLIDTYKKCEQSAPGIRFGLMECSDRDGGRMLFHRTHQHGLSVDFMVPKTNGEEQVHLYDGFGIAHYLLDFDEQGRLPFDPATRIDFESMARHLLALEASARTHGLRIRKVIFRLELMDELLSSSSGRMLRDRDIWFVPRLGYWTNRVHDDHYHVDFEMTMGIEN